MGKILEKGVSHPGAGTVGENQKRVGARPAAKDR
jgi:hypothetical protein